MNRKKVLIAIIILTAVIIFFVIVLNPHNRYKTLSIDENKWNNIINSRTENSNLMLENIKFNDYSLIIDEANSKLYYSVVNNSKTKYNPIVSYDTIDNNIKLEILSEEITDEKILNNYEFKIMIYNEEKYHIYSLICTDFPILNISYNDNVEVKNKNIQAEIYLFDNLSNMHNKILRTKGKLDILENDKEYKLSLFLMSPGKNRRESKISILNMAPSSEYILKIKDEIKEDSYNKNLKNNVELFINNEYKGLYLIENLMEMKR